MDSGKFLELLTKGSADCDHTDPITVALAGLVGFASAKDWVKVAEKDASLYGQDHFFRTICEAVGVTVEEARKLRRIATRASIYEIRVRVASGEFTVES